MTDSPAIFHTGLAAHPEKKRTMKQPLDQPYSDRIIRRTEETLMENRLMTAGYVSLDITPSFPHLKGDKPLREVIRPGKLVNTGAAAVACGGAVSNTGIALHRLGADVVLTAKIGDDPFGKMIREEYREAGVQADFIVEEGTETSYTLALAVPGSDRCFLADAGANDTFCPSDLKEEALERIQYFHFGYPTLMRNFYEEGGKALEEMYRHVKSLGIVTSLDVAAVDDDSDAGKADWRAILKRTLPYVDFFVPSIEELCYMLDRERYDRWQRDFTDDICMHLSLKEDVIPLAGKALALGCRAILLKCGAAGMYLATSSQEQMNRISEHFRPDGWGDLAIFEDSYVPSRIRSGTGAGDTAIAAFLFGISHGVDPQMCMHMAAGCGALCITEYDAQSGIVSAEKLTEKIRAGWAKQHLIGE